MNFNQRKPKQYFSLFILIIVIIQFSSMKAGDTHNLEFNAQGRLLTAPPHQLNKDDTIKFIVHVANEDREKLTIKVVDRLMAGIEEIDKLLMKAKQMESHCNDKAEPCVKTLDCLDNDCVDGYKLDKDVLFGIKDTTLEAVRCEMWTTVESILNSNPSSQSLNYYKSKHSLLSTNCNTVSNLDYVPSADGLTAIELSVTLKIYDADGAFLKTVSLNLTNSQNEKNRYQNVIPLKEIANVGKIEFELRQKNALMSQIANWADQHPMSDNLKEKIKKALCILKEKEGPSGLLARLQKELKLVSGEIQKIYHGKEVTQPNSLLIDAKKQLCDALKCLHELKYGISDVAENENWIANWLWLTKGKPMLNPIQSFSTKKLEDEIKADKKKLERLSAQIMTLELFAKNQGFKIKYIEKQHHYTDSTGTPKLERYNIDDELKNLSKIRADHDALVKKIAKSEKTVKGRKEANLDDVFLYRGLLFVNNKRGVLMQHHDALLHYQRMNRKTVEEIREDQLLYILATNEINEKKLILEESVTIIETDLSPISEEIALSPTVSIADILKQPVLALKFQTFLDSALDTSLKVVKFRLPVQTDLGQNTLAKCTYLLFQNKYSRLQNTLKFLDAQLSVPSFPVKKDKDSSPQYISRLIPHDPTVKAPVMVKYTIKAKDGDKEENLKTTEYRVNKLYQVRFRAGFVYSLLRKTDYTITKDEETGENTATENNPRFGIDGTFGIQVYPFLKRDIRKFRGCWERIVPILYVGFSVRNLTQNLYLGTGLEPYSGVTLMAGLHLGEVEELITDANGMPMDTKKDWKGDWFVSFTLDTGLFRSLFSF